MIIRRLTRDAPSAARPVTRDNIRLGRSRSISAGSGSLARPSPPRTSRAARRDERRRCAAASRRVASSARSAAPPAGDSPTTAAARAREATARRELAPASVAVRGRAKEAGARLTASASAAARARAEIGRRRGAAWSIRGRRRRGHTRRAPVQSRPGDRPDRPLCASACVSIADWRGGDAGVCVCVCATSVCVGRVSIDGRPRVRRRSTSRRRRRRRRSGRAGEGARRSAGATGLFVICAASHDTNRPNWGSSSGGGGARLRPEGARAEGARPRTTSQPVAAGETPAISAGRRSPPWRRARHGRPGCARSSTSAAARSGAQHVGHAASAAEGASPRRATGQREHAVARALPRNERGRTRARAAGSPRDSGRSVAFTWPVTAAVVRLHVRRRMVVFVGCTRRAPTAAKILATCSS